MSDLRALQTDFWTYLHGQPDMAPSALQLRVRGRTRAQAAARLRIYRDMYLARLVEALRHDFPRLAAWLDDGFYEIARAYIGARPSEDPDIGAAGQDLPAFLQRVATTCVTPQGRTRARIAAELAALEWARGQVFVATDMRPLAIDALRAVPPEEVANVHFTMIEALCVVEAEHDIGALWNALGDGDATAKAPRETLTVAPLSWAVWRRGDDVLHAPVTTKELRAMQAAKADATFAQICALFADHENPACAAFAVIGSWFADGWVAAVD